MEKKNEEAVIKDGLDELKEFGIKPYTIEEIRLYQQESPVPFKTALIFDGDVKSQGVQYGLGRRGVENIINDSTLFPDQVYRPNPDNFVIEVLEESKRPKLVRSRKKKR